MLELREDGEGFVAVVRHQLMSYFDEGIGRTSHRREDYNLRLWSSCDEVCYVSYALGGGYRRTSELHYFQRLLGLKG